MSAHQNRFPKIGFLGAFTLVLLLSISCRPSVQWAGIRLLYREAILPDGRIVRDIAYRSGSDFDPKKHRLDLYLPSAGTEPFPTLIFVHGGGWDRGDKDLEVGGADIYGNIGRFFAARGAGVAVVGYRLQPKANWRQQVEDVAGATAWVMHNIRNFGGDPTRIALSGHSAGAYMGAHLALKEEPLETEGAGREGLCGFISISGAGFDMIDPKTYELGAQLGYLEKRFRDGDPTDSWQREASPALHFEDGAPPALLAYAEGEWPWLGRQNDLLQELLERQGVENQLVVLPGPSHRGTVLALSRPKAALAQLVLEYLDHGACGPLSRPSNVSGL